MADDPTSGPPTEPVDSAVGVMVTNEGAAQDVVSENLVNALMLLWAGFTAYYAGDAVAQFGSQVARLVIAAQQQAGRITEAHLRQQVRQMGLSLPSGTLTDLPTDLRLGAETADVYQRPIREVRYLVSTGVPEPEAVESARQRLERLALTDLQLARATSAQQVFYQFKKATGWRRVIHPELGNVCGLCIAASDRIYKRIQRLDIHPGCKCTILPIIGEDDPGGKLNAEDLSRIYEAAGDTTASRALAKTRFEVTQNGELGYILTPVDSTVKGPKQVKRQLSDRAAELRKAQLQKQIDALQDRAKRSKWHADRIEQLQALLDAA